MRARTVGAIAFALALSISLSEPAVADEVDHCIDAHELVQKLRSEQKLKDAAASVLSCVRAECPTPLRAECERWREEITEVLPTVVIVATDVAGQDLDASLVIDGQRVASRLGGAAIAVDPGWHVFRVEPRQGAALERRILIREGEKERRIEMHAVKPTTVRREAVRPVPWPVYPLIGLGSLALIGSGYFLATALGDERELDGCSPSCSDAEVDSVNRKYLYADIAGGVGIAALGAATIIYLTRPRSHRSERVERWVRIHARAKPFGLALGSSF